MTHREDVHTHSRHVQRPGCLRSPAPGRCWRQQQACIACDCVSDSGDTHVRLSISNLSYYYYDPLALCSPSLPTVSIAPLLPSQLTLYNYRTTAAQADQVGSVNTAAYNQPPSTPPRTHASNAHARTGSAQLTPPVLYVTPSVDQENTDQNAPALSANRAGHSPSASVDSTNGNVNYYPPSPTLSAGSHLAGGAKIATPTTPGRNRGHSPTKSEDSHFYQFLEESARKQQETRARGDTVNSTTPGAPGKALSGSTGTASSEGKGHNRRPSAATSGLSTFTALDGPRAKEGELNPAGYENGVRNGDLEAGQAEPVAATEEEAEPRKVKTGIFAKIPFLSRFAKEKDAPKKIVLNDPTPQEMGVFGPMVPSVLNGLIDPKSLPNLESMGGDKALLEKLHTNPEMGLSEKDLQAGATIEDRKRVYGENKLPARKSKTLLQLMWIAYQDKLLVSAIFIYVSYAVS